jgi:glyoxylase-like metal-dependent hydrolase (beta-lactamase superfamily II)
MRIRSLLLMVCGALFLSVLTGQELPTRQLAPGVFFWQGDRDQRQPANCVWVQFKDHVLVVDANFPWAAKQIMSQIRGTTHGPVRYVIDTHWHNDHTFGNCIYTDAGAFIVSSQECADELASRGPASWNNWNDTAHPLTGYQLVRPSITFTDRMNFDDGTERVEITRVEPSHSKGDAVAYLPKHKILITGDLVVNWGFGNNNGDMGGNPENWIRVLDDLLKWEVKIVVPGHGAPVDLAKLREQRDYLKSMLDQVKHGIRAGKTADELVREIDLAKYGSFGMNTGANATSIRAMFRFVTAGRK